MKFVIGFALIGIGLLFFLAAFPKISVEQAITWLLAMTFIVVGTETMTR